jgi:hypothetical protein
MTDTELDSPRQRSRVNRISDSQRISTVASSGSMFEFTPRSTCRKALGGVLFYMGTVASGEVTNAR